MGVVGLPGFPMGGQGGPGSEGEQEGETCRGAERAVPKSGQKLFPQREHVRRPLDRGARALHVLRVRWTWRLAWQRRELAGARRPERRSV